jgi:hypothetical protein
VFLSAFIHFSVTTIFVPAKLGPLHTNISSKPSCTKHSSFLFHQAGVMNGFVFSFHSHLQ